MITKIVVPVFHLPPHQLSVATQLLRAATVEVANYGRQESVDSHICEMLDTANILADNKAGTIDRRYAAILMAHLILALTAQGNP
jgi:hypothetical protein